MNKIGFNKVMLHTTNLTEPPQIIAYLTITVYIQYHTLCLEFEFLGEFIIFRIKSDLQSTHALKVNAKVNPTTHMRGNIFNVFMMNIFS